VRRLARSSSLSMLFVLFNEGSPLPKTFFFLKEEKRVLAGDFYISTRLKSPSSSSSSSSSSRVFSLDDNN
jgi:hypothetical protein